MSLDLEITAKPPADFAVRSATQVESPGPYMQFATTAEAYAAALARLGSFSDYEGAPPFSYGTKRDFNQGTSPPQTAPLEAIAGVGNSKYRFHFYTATCYCKFWWVETVSNGAGLRTAYEGPGTILSATPRSWEWTPTSVNGLCLPADFDVDDVTTWNVSPEYILNATEPPDPTYADPGGGSIYHGLFCYLSGITQVRYSWVSGYEPPEDGGANGFPV